MSESVARTYRSIRRSMLSRHFVRKLTNRTDSLLRNRAIDAYNLVSIDPHCIEYIQTLPNGHPDEYLRGRLDKYQSYHLRGGDWDQHVFPIEETTFYQALYQRFTEGRKWERTCLHPDRYDPDNPKPRHRYLELSKAEFQENVEMIDRLYHSLKTDGYRPYYDRGDLYWDEPALNIGREGSVIRNSSGLHRIICAQLLNLSKISARILCVHSAYMESTDSLRMDPA